MTPRQLPGRHRTGRLRVLGPITAVLCLFAACLDTGSGEGCACGGERPEDGEDRAPIPGNVVSSEPAHQIPPASQAPASQAPPDFEQQGWNRLESRAGRYVVHWRTPSGRVPRNEDFELEVWIMRDGAPARDAALTINAWMPDHSHGMLRKTSVERRGDGSFFVEGMLLHMRGRWLLRFDVLEGVLAETAECELQL